MNSGATQSGATQKGARRSGAIQLGGVGFQAGAVLQFVRLAAQEKKDPAQDKKDPPPTKACPACLSDGLPLEATKCRYCGTELTVAETGGLGHPA